VVAVYLWTADHFRVNSNELYAGCANEAYSAGDAQMSCPAGAIVKTCG